MTFLGYFRTGLLIIFQIFFHVQQPALNGMSHGAFVHAIGLGNLRHALAENDAGVDPTALRFRQGVDRMAQAAKVFLAFQKFLRSRLGKAGRVFDPIITIKGILCLVPGNASLVGPLVLLILVKRFGNIVGNFNELVCYVPCKTVS